MEIVNCKEVAFTYPTSEYPAISNINLSVSSGEFCLILGESAVGKTTLLKLLKKQIAPAGKLSGKININGSVGYVAQNVDESIVCDKVRAELSFGLANMGLSGDKIDLLVAETASYFDLQSKLDCDISTLSSGEKQMVNLAAVMIMKPNILVLDEPTSQLDPVAAINFINMVKKLHTDFGITIIMCDHLTNDMFTYATSVYLITDGGITDKHSPLQMAKYLKDNNSPMLDALPLQLRLYSNANTISDCKSILNTKQLTNVPIQNDNVDKALTVKGLTFAYNKNNDILSSLDFTAYSGKINAIVGPNGSGKSTLLKCIVSVCKAYRGKVKENGKMSMLTSNVLDLFTHDKCSDEVQFGNLTDFLQIGDIANSHPYDLSGGQAQRLALAKVLATGADIILLDEPTKALDVVLKNKLAVLLKDLCKQGKTIIIVSHDIEFVGRNADYVSFLSGGKIVATNSRRKFFSSLSFYTTAVARLTAGHNLNLVSIDDLKDAGGI